MNHDVLVLIETARQTLHRPVLAQPQLRTDHAHESLVVRHHYDATLNTTPQHVVYGVKIYQLAGGSAPSPETCLQAQEKAAYLIVLNLQRFR